MMASFPDAAVRALQQRYDTDQAGRPIPDAEKEKWFVSAQADMFPPGEIEAIPLSETEAEAEELAVTMLGLRELQEAINSMKGSYAL